MSGQSSTTTPAYSRQRFQVTFSIPDAHLQFPSICEGLDIDLQTEGVGGAILRRALCHQTRWKVTSRGVQFYTTKRREAPPYHTKVFRAQGFVCNEVDDASNAGRMSKTRMFAGQSMLELEEVEGTTLDGLYPSILSFLSSSPEKELLRRLEADAVQDHPLYPFVKSMQADDLYRSFGSEMGQTYDWSVARGTAALLQGAIERVRASRSTGALDVWVRDRYRDVQPFPWDSNKGANDTLRQSLVTLWTAAFADEHHQQTTNLGDQLYAEWDKHSIYFTCDFTPFRLVDVAVEALESVEDGAKSRAEGFLAQVDQKHAILEACRFINETIWREAFASGEQQTTISKHIAKMLTDVKFSDPIQMEAFKHAVLTAMASQSRTQDYSKLCQPEVNGQYGIMEDAWFLRPVGDTEGSSDGPLIMALSNLTLVRRADDELQSGADRDARFIAFATIILPN